MQAAPQLGSIGPVVAKVNHAGRHLETLIREIKEWFDLDPYTLHSRPEGRSCEHEVYARFTVAPDVERWGLVAGDVIHNLRASLDHLVYQMAIRSSGVDPPPCEDKLAFPIFETPHKWKSSHGEWRVTLNAPMREFLHELQPFVTHPGEPHGSDLLLLRDLDDFTKHRLIQPVASAAENFTWSMTSPDSSDARCRQVVRFAPLEHEATLVDISVEIESELHLDADGWIAVMVVHPPHKPIRFARLDAGCEALFILVGAIVQIAARRFFPEAIP